MNFNIFSNVNRSINEKPSSLLRACIIFFLVVSQIFFLDILILMPFSLSLYYIFFLHGQAIIIVSLLTLLTQLVPQYYE
jgi:hypothetical protein